MGTAPTRLLTVLAAAGTLALTSCAGVGHDLTCLSRDERLATCTGGDNAAVHFS